jgi:hypothetical protein
MYKRRKITKGLAIVLTVITILTILISSSQAFAVVKYIDNQGKEVVLDEFRDIKGHWARDIIKKWEDYEIIQGYDGNFNPNNNILRRDVAVILDRLMGLTDISIMNFSDLETNQYYTEPILRMVAAQAIDINDNKIRPNVNATREEVAYMISRVFGIEGISSQYHSFTDINQASSKYIPYINALYLNGYIKGKSYSIFDPKGNITRAELMTMIDNIIGGYYTKRGTYTDYYNGNMVVNGKSISFYGSQINGDLYFTQGAQGQYTLDTVDINGDLIVLGRNVTLNFQRSKIKNIVLNGKTTINGADQLENIYISKFATESSITGNRVNSVTLEPNTTININLNGFDKKIELNNTNNVTKIYTKNEMEALLLDTYGRLPYGPTITNGTTTIDHKNVITFNDFLVNAGENKISNCYIIYNRDNTTPTVDDYYKRINVSNDIYDSKLSTQIDEKIKDGDTYTFRIYCIDKEGIIAYSTPIKLTGYDFETSLSVSGTGPANERFTLKITGENIPQISAVNITYTNRGSSHNEIPLRIESNTVSNNKRTMIYSGNAKLMDGLTYDFGYRIVFNTSEDLVRNNVRSITYREMDPTGVYAISTGNATTFQNNSVTITNNSIIPGTSNIVETGVAYNLYEYGDIVDVVGGDWQHTTTFKEGGVYSDNYDTKLTVNQYDDKILYYAAYAKTDKGYAYGSVKSITSNGAPFVLSNDYTILDDSSLAVLIRYSSSANIDMYKKGSITGFSSNGIVNTRYFGDTFNIASGQRSSDYVSLIFKDLDLGEYSIKYKLFNTYNASKEQTIEANLNKHYKIDLVEVSTYDGETLYQVNVSNSSSRITMKDIRKRVLDNYTVVTPVLDANNNITHIKVRNHSGQPLVGELQYKDNVRTYNYTVELKLN